MAAPSPKALKMMGVDDGAIANESKWDSFLSGSGHVGMQEYMDLWHSLDSHTGAASHFLRKLIQALVERDDESPKRRGSGRKLFSKSRSGNSPQTFATGSLIARRMSMSPSSERAPFSGRFNAPVEGDKSVAAFDQEFEVAKEVDARVALLNTIYYVSMFFDVDFKEAELSNALNSWKLWKDAYGRYHGSFVDVISRVLGKDSYLHTPQGIHSLIQECFKVRAPGDDKFFLELTDKAAVARGFAYPHLMRCAAKEKNARLIYEFLEKSLCMLAAMPDNSNEDNVRGLLHLLKELLSTYPIAHRGMLAKLEKAVQPFLFWPNPVSNAARQLMELLAREHVQPGWALRRTVMDELPTRGGTARRSATVHVLVNEASRASSTFHTMFGLARDVNGQTLVERKKDVVYNILNALLDGPHVTLNNCTEEEVEGIYVQLRRILYTPDMPLHVQKDHLMRYKMRELAHLHLAGTGTDVRGDDGSGGGGGGSDGASEVAQKATQERGRKGSGMMGRFMNTIARKSVSAGSSGGANVTGRGAKGETETLLMAHLPRVAPLTLKYDWIETNRNLLDEDTVSSLQMPAFKKNMTLIADILKTYPKSRWGTPVKFCLMGGDSVVHYFLAAFAALQLDQPQLLEGLRVNVFIVPANINNFLCSYIARYDGWYCRHVVIPALSPQPLVPHLDETRMPQVGRDQDATPTVVPTLSANSPSMLWHRGIQGFFRSAERHLPVQVYKCEMWCAFSGTNLSSDDPDYRTIAFCQRCEIGEDAYVRSFAEVRGLRATPDEVRRHRDFSFQPMAMRIVYKDMDLMGIARSDLITHEGEFMRIQLTNVPTVNDANHSCNPVSEWVELTTVQATGKSKASKNAQMSDDVRMRHCCSVEIMGSTDAHFDVLLDGHLYGPVRRIKVTPMRTTVGSLMKLPLNTFMDMSNPL